MPRARGTASINLSILLSVSLLAAPIWGNSELGSGVVVYAESAHIGNAAASESANRRVPAQCRACPRQIRLCPRRQQHSLYVRSLRTPQRPSPVRNFPKLAQPANLLIII